MNDLNSLMTNLDARKAAILQYLNGLSESDLKRVPRRNAWSPRVV